MQNRPVRVAVLGALAFLFAYAFVVACGGDRPLAASDRGSVAGILTGACGVEGQQVACHYETGRTGNIVNCFSGTQTCQSGFWGPCGAAAGTIGTLSTFDLNLAPSVSTLNAGLGGGIKLLSITGSVDAQACLGNACNPYCLGIDTLDADVRPDGGFVTGVTVQGSLIGYNSWPPAKKNGMDTTPGWCPMSVPAPTTGTNAYRECNYDYCCATPDGGGTMGTCTRWVDQPEAGTCAGPPPGTDFTVGVGCTDALGNVHIPVCNRGSADATSGSLILIEWSSNPNTSGTSSICQVPTSGTYGGKCTVDLGIRNIAAGGCIDMNLGSPPAGVTCDTPLFTSGNRASMINPPTGTYGGTSYTQLAEADACNNQSFVYTQTGTCAVYGAQPPPPASVTFRYTATCPPGFRPQWSQLAYTSIVPDQSEVIFTASTASYQTDGGLGPFSPSVQVAQVTTAGGVTGPDPADCPMGGDGSPCPKNLATILGAAAFGEELELGIALNPITAVPVVTGWQITYSCVPYE